MLVRFTLVVLGLAVANTADAQLQQPTSLQVRPAAATKAQPLQSAPQPPALRDSKAKAASPRVTPIVFDDEAADGPLSAPDYAESVPHPEDEEYKGNQHCSHCNSHNGCHCRHGLFGCMRQHKLHYFGYDPEAWATPFGEATVTHLEKQVANGVAARMTLYSYDFTMASRDEAKLNAAGWQQLARIRNLAERSDFPIVVESTPGNRAAEIMRRQAVLDGLRAMGSTIAVDRVVIAEPAARGVNGDEAMIIYNNLLQQTQVRGEVVDDQFTTDGGDSSSSDSGTSN